MTARLPRIVTDGAWIAMTAGLVGMVWRYGVNLPYLDEWPMTAALAGPEPLWPWLWSWHNEHLLPLPRLFFWASFQLGHDLRLAMVLSVAVWSALTRLLMTTARRLRGASSYSDAAFPLLLLHPGQAENVLMAYQIGFSVSALLAGVQLIAILGGPVSRSRVGVVGTAVALLPLCGAHGLLFALAGHAYLVASLVRGPRVVASCGLVAGLLMASLYVWWPGKPDSSTPPDLTPHQFLAGALSFGASGWGLAGEWLWPATGVVPVVVTGFVSYVLVSFRLTASPPPCGGGLWFAGRRPDSVPASPAFLGAAGAIASGAILAAAVSWGRGRYGVECVFAPRYVGLAGMLPVSVALVSLRFGSERMRRLVPTVVAGSALAALPVNVWQGVRWAGGMAHVQRTTLDRLGAGVPVEVVAEQSHFLTFNDPAAGAAWMGRYASSGVGPVTSVRHQPAFREEPLPPPRADGFVRVRDTGHIVAESLTFDVSPSRPAYAVAIRGTYRPAPLWPPAVATVAVRRTAGGPEEVFAQPVFRRPTTHGDPLILVWVDGPVASVRVVPDAGMWGFRVTDATLRVKP